MLSVEEYERGDTERQILRLLARGEKEISDGKACDLDDEMSEADRLFETADPE